MAQPQDRRGQSRRKPQDPPAGPPGRHSTERGWRSGDPKGDSILPGREFGAGGQVDDGPDIGTGTEKPKP